MIIFVSYTDALLKEGKRNMPYHFQGGCIYIYVYVCKSFSRQMFHRINSSLVNAVNLKEFTCCADSLIPRYWTDHSVTNRLLHAAAGQNPMLHVSNIAWKAETAESETFVLCDSA